MKERGRLLYEKAREKHMVLYTWERASPSYKAEWADLETAIRNAALKEAAKVCQGDFDSEMRSYGDYFAADILALMEKGNG